MRWRELSQEPCSVARSISVIGDRWTLMILRDCFLGVRRFDDFQSRLGITRHVLADRLRKLVRLDVLARVAYRSKPRRFEYRLTRRGLDLYPVLLALVHWGDVHMAGKSGRPLVLEHEACGHAFDPLVTCSACGEPLDARHVRARPGPGATRPGAPVPPPRSRSRRPAAP